MPKMLVVSASHPMFQIPDLKVIPDYIFKDQGWRLDGRQRLSWSQAKDALHPSEKVVIVMTIRGFDRYGIIVESATEYNKWVARSRGVYGVYAAGPSVLAKQHPYVPYCGP